MTGVRCTTCLRQLTFWITLAVSRHLAEPTFCMQSKANHYVILGTCLNKDNNVCKGFSRQQHAGSQELFQLIALSHSINLVALKIVLYFTMKGTHKRAFGRWSR